jgi:hypothetical protein
MLVYLRHSIRKEAYEMLTSKGKLGNQRGQEVRTHCLSTRKKGRRGATGFLPVQKLGTRLVSSNGNQL